MAAIGKTINSKHNDGKVEIYGGCTIMSRKVRPFVMITPYGPAGGQHPPMHMTPDVAIAFARDVINQALHANSQIAVAEREIRKQIGAAGVTG